MNPTPITINATRHRAGSVWERVPEAILVNIQGRDHIAINEVGGSSGSLSFLGYQAAVSQSFRDCGSSSPSPMTISKNIIMTKPLSEWPVALATTRVGCEFRGCRL